MHVEFRIARWAYVEQRYKAIAIVRRMLRWLAGELGGSGESNLQGAIGGRSGLGWAASTWAYGREREYQAIEYNV